MSYTQRVVSVNSTELAFLQAFIAAITAADSRITCTTNDLETQFASTSNRPTFTLSVDGAYTVIFTRGAALSSTVAYYNVTSSHNALSQQFSFAGFGLAYSATELRTWKFTVAANSDVLSIYLIGFNESILEPKITFLSVRNGSTPLTSRGTALARAITQPLTDANSNAYSKIDRMPYTYNTSSPDQIEVITGKVFCTSNTSDRAFSLSKLWDVTTVTADTRYQIDSKNYLSLDTNTLMEV